LALAQKLEGGRGKLVLRRLLSRYVPEPLFERPKNGFGVPIYRWLRGPLRDWAENRLDKQRLEREGHFNPHRFGVCGSPCLAATRSGHMEATCCGASSCSRRGSNTAASLMSRACATAEQRSATGPGWSVSSVECALVGVENPLAEIV
jgi:hypothetical protein